MPYPPAERTVPSSAIPSGYKRAVRRFSPLPLCLALFAVCPAQKQSSRQDSLISSRTLREENEIADRPYAGFISRAEAGFARGKGLLTEGRLREAREEFDRALDAILESGFDLRDEARLRLYYDRLVERIYREEVPPERSTLTGNDPEAGRTRRAGFAWQDSAPIAGDVLAQTPPASAGAMRSVSRASSSSSPPRIKLAAASSSRRVRTARQIARESFPSIVELTVRTDDPNTVTLGSGFFVAPGVIVTSRHVVLGGRAAIARTADGAREFRGMTLLAFDERSDLALLKIDDAEGAATVPALVLTEGAIEVGEPAYALGNPRDVGATISPGIVSAVRKLEEVALVQFTAPISPGSSGGPVVNEYGEVIGIVRSTRADGQNLNFAVAAAELRKLVERANTIVVRHPHR